MSMDGPCSVLRGSSMRGLSSFNSSGDIFSNRGGHPHPNMAVRCGGASAPPAPTQAAPSSAAWDAQEEHLPDIDSSLPDLLAAPTLRSVSSIFMSMDAAEDGVSSSAEMRNRTNNITNSSCGERSKAGGGGGGGGGVAVSAVDELMSRLPEPMGTCDNLTREQSFPPPFRPRFSRDQSFPPPVQSGGMTVDMLPSSSSSMGGGGGGGWSHGGETTGGMAGGVFGNGGGGGPSSPKFHGLGFPGSGGSNSNGNNGSGNGETPLRMKQQPSPWGPDGAGGRGHPGGGTGGGSLGDKEQHPVYLAASSSSRPRRSSFDTLAGMIPGIPSWPALSPSPSSPQTPSSGSTAVTVGELDVHVHGGGGGVGGASGSSISTPKVKPAPVLARPQASRPPPAAGYSSSTSSPSTSPPSPPSPPPQARGRSIRPGKKPKKQHLRRADSPPPSRWNDPPAAATNPVKKSPSSGTGKRGLEMPPSCGPVRLGGGPADHAQLERRRVKIQRYLYKRSRRKFAKSTRDASPSRSRPKAAALRPRVKGKFVKTVPDFISVNAGQQPGEEMGGGVAGTGGMSTEASGSANMAASVRYPAVAQDGGVFGGRCGGGVRSVRNGGSVNVNFDSGKAFSSAPSSSLMPRGVGGGGVHPPPVSALSPGAPNTLSWSTEPSPMSM